MSGVTLPARRMTAGHRKTSPCGSAKDTAFGLSLSTERHHEPDQDVSLTAYLRAVRAAQANPQATFKTGLTTWWPTTGAEIMQQFREGIADRINQGTPCSRRSRKFPLPTFTQRRPYTVA